MYGEASRIYKSAVISHTQNCITTSAARDVGSQACSHFTISEVCPGLGYIFVLFRWLLWPDLSVFNYFSLYFLCFCVQLAHIYAQEHETNALSGKDRGISVTPVA